MRRRSQVPLFRFHARTANREQRRTSGRIQWSDGQQPTARGARVQRIRLPHVPRQGISGRRRRPGQTAQHFPLQQSLLLV